MNNEVKYSIKLNVDGSFDIVDAAGKVVDLGHRMDEAARSGEQLNATVINFSQVMQGIDAARGVFADLAAGMGSLTSAYAAQLEAETKLSAVMRNTMEATEADLRAIRDLTAAQQQLGVVGDEVQLSGAQELATYLTKRQTLEQLIPVMNDMVAQQYGFSASQENAAQIATMLGKVMEGQTAALSRYGYSFTEAQEHVLKFGTEEERAAVLAEVVSSAVGGVNASLAATPYGRMTQLANAVGDVKEQVGAALSGVMPFVAGLNQMAGAASGVAKLTQTVRTMTLAVRAAAVANGTLTASTVALYSALTLGIAGAIAAIAAALSGLASAADEAESGLEGLKEASDAMRSAVGSARGELEVEIARLKDLKDSGADAAKAVSDLNARYGEAFGHHKTAAEWYDTLIAKSETYCRQLGYEAQAKVLAAQKAAKEMELADAQQHLTQLDAAGQGYRTIGFRDTASGLQEVKGASQEYLRTEKAVAALTAEVDDLDRRFKECAVTAAEAGRQMQETLTPKGDGGSRKVRLADFDLSTIRNAEEALAALREAQKDAAAEDLAAINYQIAAIQRLIAELQGKPQAPIAVPIRPTLQAIDFSGAEEALKKAAAGIALPELTLTPSVQLSPLKAYHKAVREATEANAGMIEGLRGMGSAMSAVGDAIGGAAGEWLKWGANLMQAVAGAIPALMGLTNMQNAQATANTAAMATGAGASVASIPFVGPVLAVAAIASVLAAIASLPKFAAGGIASGPTLGWFGEYAGASSNPEVVAPLSRLRELLGDTGGAEGEIAIRIQNRTRGRDLLGVIRREERIRGRG